MARGADDTAGLNQEDRPRCFCIELPPRCDAVGYMAVEGLREGQKLEPGHNDRTPPWNYWQLSHPLRSLLISFST